MSGTRVRLADALTAVRYICTPLVIWLIFLENMPAAVSVYALALVTDILDGYFARRSAALSSYGATFDGLADIFLVYGTIVALAIKGDGFWLMVGGIAGIAYLLPVLSIIRSKRKGPTIPHLDTGLLAVAVHATLLAHLVGWVHAELLLPFLALVLLYYARKYVAYARTA